MDADDYVQRYLDGEAEGFLGRFRSADRFEQVHRPEFAAAFYPLPDGTVTRDPDAAFTAGLEAGRGIVRDAYAGELSFRVKTEPHRSWMARLVAEKSRLKSETAAAHLDGDWRRKQDLIDRRDDLGAVLADVQSAGLRRYFAENDVEPGTDMAPADVVHVLDQVAEDYSGGRDLRWTADHAIRCIEETPLRVTVWDKHLDDMPTWDAYRCCYFPGFDTDEERHLLDYMDDPYTQLLHLDTSRDDEQPGMAITMRGEWRDRTYLVVDSVESRETAFAGPGMISALAAGVEAYAAALGADHVLVNDSPHAGKFLSRLPDSGYTEATRWVRKVGEQVPNETGLGPVRSFPRVSGYHTEVA